jgi:hypothetical protein
MEREIAGVTYPIRCPTRRQGRVPRPAGIRAIRSCPPRLGVDGSSVAAELPQELHQPRPEREDEQDRWRGEDDQREHPSPPGLVTLLASTTCPSGVVTKTGAGLLRASVIPRNATATIRPTPKPSRPSSELPLVITTMDRKAIPRPTRNSRMYFTLHAVVHARAV